MEFVKNFFDLLLIFVDAGGVDMAVPKFEGGGESVDAILTFELVGAVAEEGYVFSGEEFEGGG